MSKHDFIEKEFHHLSPEELYRIIQLRSAVFIVEQSCPYQDLDDLDQHMVHLWCEDTRGMQAYVRIAPPGTAYEHYSSIGRVVSAQESRGSGLGRSIFQYALQQTVDRYPDFPIKISAQYYLRRFYEGFGFECTDELYLEDGIPHVAMIKTLNRTSSQ